MDLAFFAGPTVFQVAQRVVTGVGFTQRHPFDAVDLTRAQIASHSGTSTGFHAGAEVAYFFSTWAGVGGRVRVSRATLELGSVGPIEAGGVHATAGLRLRF